MATKIEEEKEILLVIKDWYKDLAENGFVEKINFVWQENKERILNNLYKFLKVSSLKNILNIFKINLMFKKTDSLKLNEYNLVCWLRWWEVKIENLEVGDYSKNKLKNILIVLKIMTKDEFIDINKIQRILAGVWIYFSFVPWFKNVPVFGITRRYMWKPFIQISDKGKKADWFWFALFHELAHVQFHLHKKDDIFLNIFDEEQNIEAEANKWARDYFINEKEYKWFLNNWNITVEKLMEFSEKNWIWYNIVAWRLWFDHGIYWWEISKLRTPLRILEN
jgi:HTH-type transcriptional regulator/antitoxin HigA